jgi:hypothetical protein
VPNVVEVVENGNSDEQSKVNENENGTTPKKKNKIRSVCKFCHEKGHQRQYLGKCLLSTNCTSRYYKPGNVGAQCKFRIGNLSYVSVFCSPTYPYFPRQPSGTLALQETTEDGILDEFEGVKTK